MRAQTEPSLEGAGGEATRIAAFGLALDVDPRIDVSALGAGASTASASAPSGTPTRVVLDPDEVERRWAPVAATARRMRELRAGDATLLTVDLAESAGYLLRAEGVARVLVSPDGSELLCGPAPGCAEWEFILPAQALPLAATLRGLELLHASAVAVAGEAVLFSGEPGAGKSSLAAAFLRRGALLLGDDAIALERRDGSLIAHPGAAALYLRASEEERLSVAERDLLGASERFAGRRRYAPSAFAPPTPFGALFLLERGEEGPAIEAVEGDPFSLLAATFNLSVRTPERLARQLDVVAALAASGRVHRLRILPGTDATRLAAAVDRHLASR